MNFKKHHIALIIKIKGILILLFVFLSYPGMCQDSISLLPDKNKNQYLKVSGSMQFWARYTNLNPGSKILNEEQNAVWDLSIRRYRLRVTGQANDKLRYFFELGNNNLNFSQAEKSSPRLLDAYVDYQLNEYFALGFGRNSWAGLARYSAPSTTKALAYDIDFIASPYLVVYDDILRRMGIYARGKYEGLDYRFVLAKPSFYGNANNRSISTNASFADRAPEYQLSSYIKYQFLEQESQASPYVAGTYMGKKDILNLGIGAMHQPNSTWQLNENDTLYNPGNSFAADLFFEKKLSKNKGLTLYLAYVNHQLGRNFIRYMGLNNPATGGNHTDFVNGRGNNVPVVGTGHIAYLQLGYIRPVDANNKMQIQPYASMQYSRFEALHDPVLTYNTGFHYYLNGQNSKITLGYQNRPVFKQEEHLVLQGLRKDMWVLQYQILFGG